jgi:PQQ-dependent catabolism-associated CXXCW motif protein
MSHESRRRRVWSGIAPAVLSGVIAFAAAAAAGVPEPPAYWTGEVNGPVPDSLHGATVIHTAVLAKRLSRGEIVVIDVSNAPVRPAEMAPGAPWMPLPHGGLPGALWLPGVGTGVLSAPVDEWYRARLKEATRGDFDAPLAVYCHARCWLSWNAAKRAVAAGYRHVSWYPEGIEGWTAAGRMTAMLEPQPQPQPQPLSQAAPAQATGLPALMVLDLELSGDLGGPEFTAEHEARLKAESLRLRQDLAATGMYRLLDNAAVQPEIDRLRLQQAYLHDCNGCDLDLGRQLHADLALVAWVDRVSGLILTLTFEMHDVKTGQITARKSYDFRGDSDNAWNHAIDYMVRDMKSMAASAPN